MCSSVPKKILKLQIILQSYPSFKLELNVQVNAYIQITDYTCLIAVLVIYLKQALKLSSFMME